MRLALALAALCAPSVARNAPAVHDWRPVIVQPSPWDWLPEAAHLPNLGVHRLASRGE